jgi:hypothetical protein
MIVSVIFKYVATRGYPWNFLRPSICGKGQLLVSVSPVGTAIEYARKFVLHAFTHADFLLILQKVVNLECKSSLRHLHVNHADDSPLHRPEHSKASTGKTLVAV